MQEKIMIKKLICITLLISIALTIFVACDNDKDPTPSELYTSITMLTENTELNSVEALSALEILCECGLDSAIEYIYTETDSSGASFYKIWHGLNLLKVYIEDGKVTKVYKHSTQLYPRTIENDPEDPPKTDNGDDDPPTTDQNEPQPLDIQLVSLTSPIKAGSTAKIEIKGSPNTEYIIKVIYSSGASSAKGLEPKTSDANGFVSWSWKVSALVKAGEYSIEISDGDASYKTTFTVE